MCFAFPYTRNEHAVVIGDLVSEQLEPFNCPDSLRKLVLDMTVRDPHLRPDAREVSQVGKGGVR